MLAEREGSHGLCLPSAVAAATQSQGRHPCIPGAHPSALDWVVGLRPSRSGAVQEMRVSALHVEGSWLDPLSDRNKSEHHELSLLPQRGMLSHTQLFPKTKMFPHLSLSFKSIHLICKSPPGFHSLYLSSPSEFVLGEYRKVSAERQQGEKPLTS